MKLLYFAWVRERIGISEEELELPETVGTVGELLAWLKERGPGYESALADSSRIRVALDQIHVNHDQELGQSSEIALFPPMTGG